MTATGCLESQHQGCWNSSHVLCFSCLLSLMPLHLWSASYSSRGRLVPFVGRESGLPPCRVFVSMEGLVGYSGGQVGRGAVHGWVSATGCVRPHFWTPCILGTCRVSKNLSTGSSWIHLHDSCPVVLPASGPVLAQSLLGLGTQTTALTPLPHYVSVSRERYTCFSETLQVLTGSQFSTVLILIL